MLTFKKKSIGDARKGPCRGIYAFSAPRQLFVERSTDVDVGIVKMELWSGHGCRLAIDTHEVETFDSLCTHVPPAVHVRNV